MGILEVNKKEEDNCITITKSNLRRNCQEKGDHAQLRFIKDSVLYIGKHFITMFNVELTWFHHLVMNRDNKMRFPRWRQLVEEHIPPILQKTMDANVLPTMFICFIISDTFDLWMNQSGFNIFALVVNFIDDAWVPKHISVFLFKIPYTTCVTLVKIVKPFLAQFKLINKILTYVENESLNLNTLVFAPSIVFSCESLQLDTPFIGTCFGHVMSKTCQYFTNDVKLCVGIKEMALKNVQQTIWKTITSTKKSQKGQQEWDKACIKARLPTRNLKTPMFKQDSKAKLSFSNKLIYNM